MRRPLEGVRVVSLAINLPGPLAAARLAALGADVLKVEPPAGDPLQRVAEGWYADLIRGQQVRCLDLKTAEGSTALAGLLPGADLLLTSSRPSALAALGLGWTDLSARFPRLCQVAIVGRSGAEAELAGHDLTYQAAAGLLDGAQMPRVPYADLAGAERAAAEALAVLFARQLHGEATYREVSLAEAAAELAEPLRRGLSRRGDMLGGGLPGYNIYPSRDGYIALAALEPRFWQRLLAALGTDGSPGGLAALFATRTSSEWEAWGAAHDVPIAAVLTGL
jgi:alpha-methylacyl-CoA racemase